MKLYRFDYSCYARKVQMVLDLLGKEYQVVDVPYLDRGGLIALTGGYMQVPVLMLDDGTVLKDSRVICKALLHGEAAEKLIPSPWQGPIWAYADWCDSVLEDVLFRLACPGIRARFGTAQEKGFFTYIKERKFGEGCIDQWHQRSNDLVHKARALLKPTLETLQVSPFVFGDNPTYADASLYGHIKMVEVADADLVTQIAPELSLWMQRVKSA